MDSASTAAIARNPKQAKKPTASAGTGRALGRGFGSSGYIASTRRRNNEAVRGSQQNLVNERYFAEAAASAFPSKEAMSVAGATFERRRGTSLNTSTAGAEGLDTPSKRVSLAQQLMANKGRMLAIREQ